ncbi:MAG: glutathione S-transferase family protein [Pseudomonadota bacterium]
MTDEIILHNYPQSPVAEKARIALGIKGVSWRDVTIPRLAPKPMLTQLTGGYRRTPVMQIGADIYCDSHAIIRELEWRFPAPTFFPTTEAGLMWAASRWTDGALFDLAVKIVLGSAGDDLPADFAADRGRLYLGPDWASGLKAAHAALPHLAAQMRAPMQWLDAQLSDGRAFLLGEAVGAIDAQFYHVIWFIRGRWTQGPEFLSEFPHLERWEANVTAIGHSTVSPMSPEEAIDIAASCVPIDRAGVGAHDPQGLQIGTKVIVHPDVDGGEQGVAGTVRFADANTVSVSRQDAKAGELAVHFPRAGYRVEVQGT